MKRNRDGSADEETTRAEQRLIGRPVVTVKRSPRVRTKSREPMTGCSRYNQLEEVSFCDLPYEQGRPSPKANDAFPPISGSPYFRTSFRVYRKKFPIYFSKKYLFFIHLNFDDLF